MAWALTSMQTTCTPSSAIRRSIFCRSMGSGVVSFPSRCLSAIMDPVEPISPHFRPAFSRMLFSR